MSADVALGAILGIAGTLVGTYVAHYFEEKQEDRRAKIEEWKKVVDEVYSPLIFSIVVANSLVV
jgi:predicted transcriptional regulator